MVFLGYIAGSGISELDTGEENYQVHSQNECSLGLTRAALQDFTEINNIVHIPLLSVS